MKTAILIGDGMGDFPVESLGNKTPLQAAVTTNMRKLAAAGTMHFVQTVPDGLAPGSDVANLGLLGYDPAANYTGRAPIEAAGQHLPMKPSDVAFRCNLITVENEVMKDYSAGHISTEDATPLIEAVQEALGNKFRIFHPGVQYRHLLLWDGGPADLITLPPHDIPDQPLADHLPQGPGCEQVIELMEASKAILKDHPVNLRRIAEGKSPATQIWLWGQGSALELKSYAELYGKSGTIITAVDLIRGIGVLAGLHTPEIEGATGFVDTNYANKVAAALSALESDDFVYVHIEAPDECGHLGDAALKTQAISDFDAQVVGPIWQELERRGTPYQLVVTMDHRTPVSTKAHTSDPVPLVHVIGPTGPCETEAAFDESVAETADIVSHHFVQSILR